MRDAIGCEDWLWRWLPHRLSKRESLTTVLLRTPITQMILFNQGMLLLGSNHFLISFDVGFLDLIVFIDLGCFSFWCKSFEILLKFWAPKAAFRRNTDSVTIDFLVKKSILIQTKYVVICFTRRPTQPENIGRIYFLVVAGIYFTIGNISSYFLKGRP